MTLRLKFLSAALVVGSLFAGCCSYRVSTVGDRTMCDIDNSCLLVFVGLPVASGDPEHPNENESVAFTDTTTLSNNLSIAYRAMSRHGANALHNVTSFRTEEQFFFFLLKRSTLHTSAELVKTPVK